MCVIVMLCILFQRAKDKILDLLAERDMQVNVSTTVTKIIKTAFCVAINMTFIY